MEPGGGRGGTAALLKAFGLSGSDVAGFGKAFTAILEGSGLDGARILDRLLKGDTPLAALGLPAQTPDVVYAQAHRWLSVGRTDRAEPLFRALTILAGTIPDHWLGLGICLKSLDKNAEAEKAFSAAAQLSPGWALPHFHAAELYIQTGRARDAELALRAFSERINAETPQPILMQAERYMIALQARENASLSQG